MHSPEEWLAAGLLGSLILYAVLGGADFGGGVWDLLASGPRATAQRALIAKAIAPIWEVNHIWLILAVVLLFAGFPPAFAFLGESLHVPLTLLLLGIVARGSAFAFRSFDPAAKTWGVGFAIASLISPLLLGATVGAIASGTLQTGTAFSWLTPFSAATAVLTLVLFAFLAAVYAAAVASERELADDFRFRGLASGAALLVWGGAVLASSSLRVPPALVALTAVVAVSTLICLAKRAYRWARAGAAGVGALMVLGWGLAQAPYLIVPHFTVSQAAAPRQVLELLLLALGAGAIVLIPSLLLLFRIFSESPKHAHR